MNISSAGASSVQFAERPKGPPPGEGNTPPTHSEAVKQLGASLSTEVQDEILQAVASLEESGASDEEIKAFVHETLESHGVDIPERKSGMFVDTRARPMRRGR